MLGAQHHGRAPFWQSPRLARSVAVPRASHAQVRAEGPALIVLTKPDQKVLAPGLHLAHAHTDQPREVRHAAQQRSGSSTRLDHRFADEHAAQARGNPKEGVAFGHEADGSRAGVG